MTLFTCNLIVLDIAFVCCLFLRKHVSADTPGAVLVESLRADQPNPHRVVYSPQTELSGISSTLVMVSRFSSPSLWHLLCIGYRSRAIHQSLQITYLPSGETCCTHAAYDRRLEIVCCWAACISSSAWCRGQQRGAVGVASHPSRYDTARLPGEC